MKYIIDSLKLNKYKIINFPNICYPSSVKYCNLNYRRSYSTSNEEPSLSDRKNLYWWQFKLFSFVLIGIGSSYFAYVFVKNDYDFERSKAKLLLNWNSLLFGNSLNLKYNALVNSRFGTCLSKELNDELCKYFLNIDLNKENGFRRSDAIYFLSEVGVDEKSKIADKFVSNGIGESKDHKLLSGCTLNEFAQLVEAIVIEERLKSNNDFDNHLLSKTIDLNINNDVKLDSPVRTYMMSNPLITGIARSMSEDISKYIKDHEHEELFIELEAELDRNLKLKKKLETLSKTRRLTEDEKRRLRNINEQIVFINEELSKLRHQHRILLLI